jgi:SAM-dependent methyltransferase
MRDSHQSVAIDYRSITERQRDTWGTGDFNEIARQIMPVSEDLNHALDPRPGQQVLDVACGSGNAALVAARRYCSVSGIDYVPALIERAKVRARAEGVDVDFRVGDAQAIPFADGSADIVVSVFGVMFAPDQKKAADELLRVCRPGGKIGLACWMPEGFGIDFFGAHARYAPPPDGIESPLRWGTEAGLKDLLGEGVASIETERRSNSSHFKSIDHAIDVFSTYFGPTKKVLESLNGDDTATTGFLEDLRNVYSKHNVATDGTLSIKGDYLRIIARRKD